MSALAAESFRRFPAWAPFAKHPASESPPLAQERRMAKPA
jgi:hypothetical protein